MGRIIRAVGITFHLFLSTANTAAQPAASDAEALFRAGRVAMRAGDIGGACVHFRESHALEPTTGTRLNLALCEEELGHRVRAWQLLDELSRQTDARDPRFALAGERLDRLEAALSRVTLQVHAGAPPGSRARDAADGSPLPLGRVLAFMPGLRAVLVDAPGHGPRRYELQLTAGSEQTLVVAPGALEVAATLERSRAPSSPRPGGVGVSVQSEAALQSKVVRVPGGSTTDANVASSKSSPGHAALLAFGLGGTALMASIVSAALMLEERDVVERECTPLCSPAGLAAGGRGRTYSSVASISAIVAAAGAGLGVYLWLTEDVAAEATVRGDVSQLTFRGSF